MDELFDQVKDLPESELTIKHVEKFGVEPNIIGIYWRHPDQLEVLIEKSIDDGEPYDELDNLSGEDKKRYERGDLVF